MVDQDVPFGSAPCHCTEPGHDTRFVVLTGGPGAGKTAVLELVRRSLCRHLALVPESASILFRGGFPRRSEASGRAAAQRAIFHVQRSLEDLVGPDRRPALALCDRGTLDGLAYWPDTEESFFGAMNTTRQREMSRYSVVIHLETPTERDYDRSNALRVETAAEAREVDARIGFAWRDHPRRHFVPSTESFMEKATAALELIRRTMPVCCRPHLAASAGVVCP